MANAFDPGNEPDSAAPPDPSTGSGPPGGAGGGPSAGSGGGPPPPGGPVLAMLGRQQMSPPVTAPGPGNIAQGMLMMTQAHGLMTQALQNFPPGSPQFKDCHRAIGLMSKHMAQEAPGAGVQQNNLLDMIKNVAKNALLQKVMANRGGPPGQGGGPSAGSGGGPPGGAPNPSTPLPGA